MKWWDGWIDWECLWRNPHFRKCVQQESCVYKRLRENYANLTLVRHSRSRWGANSGDKQQMYKLLISLFIYFSSWPQQLGAEDSAGCRRRADRRGSSRRERVCADGAAQRQHHGDGLPIAGALQRWSPHPWLHRCINTPQILLLGPIASYLQLNFLPFCLLIQK